ncbi:hypothetical protein C8Q73DRAFT_791682 [Cubamyces lactineus]|nr:hypothetical protein C8Q73DRAFT_791682 [Cubamyces lactineus]
MMTQYSLAGPRPVRARKNTRSTKNTIDKERILDIMSIRCAASSLEPFLGTYRIVWDSESNYDPRDVLFASPGPDRDPSDGLLTLRRPQHAHAWPKEPAPASSVVLRLCDSFIGTNRTASTLKPSPRPMLTSESSSSLGVGGPSGQSTSSLLSSSPSPTPSPLTPSFTSSLSFVPPLQSRSSASSSSLSTAASSSRTDHARSFWRFDWDPSFPRLGFRFEGMDLTAARGHTLSFSHIRDDRGHPFAVVELRPTGWDDDDGVDNSEAMDDDEAEEEWASHRAVRRKRVFARKRQTYITVVAKRVQDQYSREGLSEAERERLGMVELDDMGLPFD